MHAMQQYSIAVSHRRAYTYMRIYVHTYIYGVAITLQSLTLIWFHSLIRVEGVAGRRMRVKMGWSLEDERQSPSRRGREV